MYQIINIFLKCLASMFNIIKLLINLIYNITILVLFVTAFQD